MKTMSNCDTKDIARY